MLFTMLDVISLTNIDRQDIRDNSFRTICPVCGFERKERTLNIDLHKFGGSFHCFVCGAHGGKIDLYTLFHQPESFFTVQVLERDNSRKAIMSGLALPEYRESAKTLNSRFENGMKKLLPLAKIEIRDRINRQVLDHCRLTNQHYQNLVNRGLDFASIQKYGYKSVPQNTGNLVRQLLRAGLPLQGIPGFYMSDMRTWSMTHLARGIFIPVRDVNKRIQGMQIRLDQPFEGMKRYLWLSSARAKQGGCKTEGWCHFVGDPKCETLIITEGALKGDLVNHFTKMTVAAVPGVSNVKHLAILLKLLKSMRLKRVIIAFDMDSFMNYQVYQSLCKLKALLDELRIYYKTALWNPDYKGLDDFYCNLKNTETPAMFRRQAGKLH